MKAIDSRNPASIAARALQIVGIILIVSSLVDYLILLFPPNFLDRQWQMGFTSQLVDRGIIPMVGMAFIFTGFGIESNAGGAQVNRTAFADIKFWVLWLASLFGLVFLLLFPLHLNNVRLDRAEKLGQISERVSQAENQIATQLANANVQAEIQKQQNQFKTQFSSVLGDEKKRDEVLKNPQLPSPIKKLIEASKSDPKAIDEFIQTNLSSDALKDRELTRIRTGKKQLEEQTQITSLKSGLQTGISSLLLSAGYMAIGWTGLKGLGYMRLGRRKTAR
ncbi:MAG: HpsJ family protein [Oscillatoria princeps RMCB-10]|jgi:hypothetical protein|nr:HpsJ family protein [Oscillatoria princeps RMCB-10]